MTVYGAAHFDRKDAFLAELAHLCSSNKGPYLICGDFNIIRYSSGKKTKKGLRKALWHV
jgi:exonuclease III